VTEAVVDPFVDEPSEVPLDPDPLLVVLTQVRFPQVLKLGDESVISEVQEGLKAEYPVLEHEDTIEILINPQASGPIAQQSGDKLWRFRSRDRLWQVTLAKGFVALDTRDYSSRSDYCERLSRVLAVVKETADPAECSRVGTRYVNRIEEPDILSELSRHIRPEILNAEAIPHDQAMLKHSLCESSFQLPNEALQMRWGKLPAGVRVDPAIPPAEAPNWILDMDMFSTQPQDFDVSVLVETNRRFAAREYAFFRWAVTDDLLRHFGGKV
jgi:uncharacterized protein (TIGR04255 family)